MKTSILFIVILVSVLATLPAWGGLETPFVEGCSMPASFVFLSPGCPVLPFKPNAQTKHPLPSTVDRGDIKNALRSFMNHTLPSSLPSVAQELQEEGPQHYALRALRFYERDTLHGLLSSLVEGLKDASPLFSHLNVEMNTPRGGTPPPGGATPSEKPSSAFLLNASWLLPWWHSGRNLLFSELNVLYQDKRPTLGVGIGDRFLNKGVLFGGNAFFDEDFRGHNTRFGAGLELAFSSLKASANYYHRLSTWQDSPFVQEDDFHHEDDLHYKERAANGYDVRLREILPFAPQVSINAAYFRWQGKHINLFDQNDTKKGTENPQGYSVGVHYTTHIFTAGVEYAHGIHNSQEGLRVDLGLQFLLGQLVQKGPSLPSSSPTPASFLFNPVDRENRIILEKSIKPHPISPRARITLDPQYVIDESRANEKRVIVPHVQGQIVGGFTWSFDDPQFFTHSSDRAVFKVNSHVRIGKKYHFTVSGKDIYGPLPSVSSFVIIKHLPFHSKVAVTLKVPDHLLPGTSSLSITVTPRRGNGTYTIDTSYGSNGLVVTDNGTPTGGWTLTPQDPKQPFRQNVGKSFTATSPQPFKLGHTYTFSVGLQDGDTHVAHSQSKAVKSFVKNIQFDVQSDGFTAGQYKGTLRLTVDGKLLWTKTVDDFVQTRQVGIPENYKEISFELKGLTPKRHMCPGLSSPCSIPLLSSYTFTFHKTSIASYRDVWISVDKDLFSLKVGFP